MVKISITYWLDAVKAVSRAENCGGIGLEKSWWVVRVLESPQKVFDFISPKNIVCPDV